ncbi:MAG TPA: gas vesicle protein [Nocardioidaceae bacterium]|jgi:hypothetical protein|nr:gas vesicle protein [Nocardioidaceae bacterium]
MATKSTAKKSTASPARKRTTAKSARKTATSGDASPRAGQRHSDPDQDGPEERDRERRDGSAGQRSGGRPSAGRIAAGAAQQLIELTGRDVEGVTGLERTDDGWTVQIEVVEVRRIPDTTDVLALYDVEVDRDGELVGYRRVRRYTRGAPGEE